MKIDVTEAIKLLNAGDVVALPTETVYGLAASIHHPEAISKIFLLKGRPSNNPLILHVNAVDQVLDYAEQIPPSFFDLVESFWPGPLTLVLKVRTEKVPSQARAGLATVAFRMPSHPLVRKILAKTPPLVMPSANLSGSPSATQAAHVETDFGLDFPVLDGGSSKVGLESTILFYQDDQWMIGRRGAIIHENFYPVLGYHPLIGDTREKPVCPGQMHRHYAPKAKLNLCYANMGLTGVVVGFSDKDYPKASKVFHLGTLTRPEQAASKLYAIFRQLDEEKITQVNVDMAFPRSGLWLTIVERLLKASAK